MSQSEPGPLNPAPLARGGHSFCVRRSWNNAPTPHTHAIEVRAGPHFGPGTGVAVCVCVYVTAPETAPRHRLQTGLGPVVVILEDVRGPVDQVEEGKHKRKGDARDHIYPL